MSPKIEEIKAKIFEALATGDYDLFEVLLGLTQAQEMILQSFNTGDLEESGDYAEAITLAQRQDIQSMATEMPEPPEKPIPVEKPAYPVSKKKKVALPPDLDDLDFGVFESPL